MKGDDLPFEKTRDETREVTDYYYGSERTEERKIAELCQYCPNFECPGAYQRTANHACYTMKDWRLDELSLEDAISAKYRQNARHERTDEFREWVFETLTSELYIPDDWRYETRSEMASFAAAVAKGRTAFEARQQFGLDDGKTIGQYVLTELSDDLCNRIESQRDALCGNAEIPDAAIPVDVGEIFDVEIVDIGREGDGVAKVDGYVLFVPETDIGDTVTVEVEETTDSVGFATVTSNPDRPA